MKEVLSRKSKKALIINLALLLVIVVCNGLILWGMFGPRVELAVQTAIAEEPNIENVVKEKPSENRLVIPSIHLDVKINEGPTEASLIGGAWRIPSTSTPPLGGNTVMAGHRFTYKGKSIFYNLDKVKIEDEIDVAYNGDIYKYRVKEIVSVDPSNSKILEPTNDNILTLYTCTPLWTTKERLVIISELMETQ